jgi:tetratricopeptide (TPR) repeat protein
LLLLIVTLAAYKPAWNGQPIWDDDHHITRPELRSVNGLTRIWTELGAAQQYYPVVHSAFWLEHRLWGDSTLGYHLLNILLRCLSAWLLLKILRRLAIPGSWFVAAIFALHPVQVESVAWISELKNTLSGVLFFATILVYLRFDSGRRRHLYIAAFGLFVLGLMSKSVIATLPVSLLVVFWWKRGRLDRKQDIVPLLPFFAAGIASGLFTAWIEQRFIIAGDEGAFALTFVERFLVAGRAVWFYLGKIVWPVDLIFIYPRWKVSQAVWWQYLFPVATLILAGALWLLRKRWRAPMAAFLYFAASLFPVMGFFNVYPFRFSFVADHFQYLACVGPITFLVGLASSSGLAKGGRRTVLCTIVLLTLVILTSKRSGVYTNEEVLYRTTIRQNPDCWLAYNNLGNVWGQSGRLEGAIAMYSRALEIRPKYALAENNLSGALLRSGRIEEAFAHCQKAVEMDPNYAEAHHNLGILLEKGGRIDEAIVQYQKEVEIDPKDAGAQNKLGNVLASVGRLDEAMVRYEMALKSNANYAEAYFNLGNVFLQKGLIGEAIGHYLKAVAIRPNYERAHSNLGHALRRAGRIDEAIAQYRKALEINPSKVSGFQNLGVALYEDGQTSDAIVVLQEGLEVAKSAGSESLTKEIAQYLETIKGAGVQVP